MSVDIPFSISKIGVYYIYRIYNCLADLINRCKVLRRPKPTVRTLLIATNPLITIHWFRTPVSIITGQLGEKEKILDARADPTDSNSFNTYEDKYAVDMSSGALTILQGSNADGTIGFKASRVTFLTKKKLIFLNKTLIFEKHFLCKLCSRTNSYTRVTWNLLGTT